MNALDPTLEPTTGPARPRTLNVLGLLVAAAGALSYLGAFALTDALRAAEVLRPWAEGRDPRPRWMLFGFAALLAVAGVAACAFRLLSRRQLRRIDQMAEAGEAGEAGEAA